MAESSLHTRRWLLLTAALAGGALVAAPRAFRRAFAPPQREAGQSPADFGLVTEEVWLRSVNGTRLHAWYVPADSAGAALVVLHGWGSHGGLMLPLAEPLHADGFHTLFLDARNHGLSEHDSFASLPRFAEDLEAAADWLRAHPDVTRVGAIGHSVGAGAAILAASRGDLLDVVVSVSAFAHPGELMRRQMARIPAPILSLLLGAVQRTIGHRFDDFAPRFRVGDVTVPLMLVHGDVDSVVPIADMYELAELAPTSETLTVEGGGHSDLAAFLPYVSEIVDFLNQHTRERSV